MTDSNLDGRDTNVPAATSRWMQRGVLGAVCATVVAVYAYMTLPGPSEYLSQDPAEANYNLLVQCFRAGQLNLKKEVPPGLAQLADPYDPKSNLAYRYVPHWLQDLSYHKGKLYLYFGITPVLILFWPFVALTGQYLSHSQAVVVFCSTGFLAGAGLLCALWRRSFAEVSVAVVAACVLALGLANGVPVLLPRSDTYEVAISCGHMLTMLALAAIWCALHQPRKRPGWLALASLLYGLAVGARPSLLFGAVILFVPVVQAWRERRQIGVTLLAAAVPIMLIGSGLMLYNAARFGSPLEFGWRYALTVYHSEAVQRFSLRYLWFNFRVYFLEPVLWRTSFPYVHDITTPTLPIGYVWVEHPFGVLSNIPVVWLVLAVPLAWRGRSAEARSVLCGFVAAAALLFGIVALTLCLFFAACARYEVDFLPVLELLAVLGILGLERALTHRPFWRLTVRCGCALLLSFSVAFNLLASVEQRALTRNIFGLNLAIVGRPQEAIAQHEQSLRLKADDAEAHYRLAVLYAKINRLGDAEQHYQLTIHYAPQMPEAYFELGVVSEQLDKRTAAAAAYRDALRVKPDFAFAHNNLANLLAEDGKLDEAIQHYRQALAAAPDLKDARRNLSIIERLKEN